MKTIPQTEAQFQKAVVHLAAIYGFRAYHTRFSFGSNRGFPDLVLAKRGHPKIFAELKTEKGKTTVEQMEWLAVLEGGEDIVKVWRPSDWEEIQRIFKGLK